MAKIKCGLEIHQMLDGKKLFCDCPTELRDETPDVKFTRRLRAVVGETGEVDIAAAQEMQKGKLSKYEGYTHATCLVEYDEEPPHEINKQALQTAVQFARMCNAYVIECAQVMRKMVVDGSNTSGFQRTALIAANGKIETKEGIIGIPTIMLEEDAARKITDDFESTTWRLDRLGIPLIEVSTTPDITTPEQAKEVAEKLGLMLRSTGHAKRGIGTIRQDINVSIEGGIRVEIKGAQDLKLVPTYVEVEAKRQETLLAIKSELITRGAKAQKPEIKNLTELFKNSDSKIIRKTNYVLGFKLEKFLGLTGKQTQPGKRLGTELSERAKIIAGVGGIIHADELPNYGITETDVSNVRKTLGCQEQDGFVIIADEENKAQKAAKAVIQRANEALIGVPSEVRNANPDGTTSYMRPMPGAARMYPETDIPLIIVDQKMLQAPLPEQIEDKIVRYSKIMAPDLAEALAKSPRATWYERIIKEFTTLKPAFVAEILIGAEKNIKSQYKIDVNPTEDDYHHLFHSLAEEKISKESIVEILKEGKPVHEIITKYYVMNDKELDAKIKTLVEKHKGMNPGAIMGVVMQELRGKASGAKISTILKKYLT